VEALSRSRVRRRAGWPESRAGRVRRRRNWIGGAAEIERMRDEGAAADGEGSRGLGFSVLIYSRWGTHRVAGMGYMRTHPHPLHQVGEEMTH
jgi:hypothetical protein